MPSCSNGAGHTVAGAAGRCATSRRTSRAFCATRSRAATRASIITTGGTGISKRDSTYEAVTALFEKRLDGFGELFRMLSFEEIGPAAMLSRATAGVVRRLRRLHAAGLGSAVRLAMTRLILPELGHIVRARLTTSKE